MNMDFDFTDDDGNGIEVEAVKPRGILLTASTGYDYAFVPLGPARAREIAHALNTAADHMENN